MQMVLLYIDLEKERKGGKNGTPFSILSLFFFFFFHCPHPSHVTTATARHCPLRNLWLLLWEV